MEVLTKEHDQIVQEYRQALMHTNDLEAELTDLRNDVQEVVAAKTRVHGST